MPADRSLRRWELGLAGILAVTGILLFGGLLAGMVARTVARCSYVTIFAWGAVQYRRGELMGGRLNHPSRANT